VTASELRDAFCRGDAELEQRFSDRVRVIVKLAVREARGGQDYP
jgi:hypothetical protein